MDCGKIRPSFRLSTTPAAQLLHSSTWYFSNISAFDREVIPTAAFQRSTYPNSPLLAHSCSRNNSCGWDQPGVPADQPSAQHHLHSRYVRHQRAPHQPDHQHQLHNSYVQTHALLYAPSHSPTPGKEAKKAEPKLSLQIPGCKCSHVPKGHPRAGVDTTQEREFHRWKH